MNFKDRITGETLSKLPKEIESGRYSVLADVVLNNHTQLNKGDILFSDGGLICNLSGDKYVFKKEGKTDELTIDAILTINELMGHQVDDAISPLLPSSLVGKELDKRSLEIRLDVSIKKGYLHHIAYKPRIDLKYDEAVIDVSRARRLSNGTLKHLASHSECWQRRTLTGVIPRKVLARFSEDDYGLYENHLYVSLLDKLENHLQTRLVLLIQLHEELSNALEFQTGNDIDYKLVRNICSLWGKTYNEEQTGKQLKASEDIRQFLEANLRTIKGLKQKGLYTQIHHKKHISHLHRTNILKHDPHYQQLPLLWEDIQKEVRILKPKEVFHHNKKIQNAYLQYIGLVIYCALEKYSFSQDHSSFLWSGSEIKLEKSTDRWLLCNSNGKTLELIVWASNTLPDAQFKKNQVICWFASEEKKNIESVSSVSGAIPATPLDLYVVERIGALIDLWLIEQLICLYGKEISPIPSKLLENLQGFSSIKPAKQGIRVVEPDTEEKGLLEILEKSDANDETKEKIKQQIEIVKELSCCPNCREKGVFKASDQGFFVKCNQCDAKWHLSNNKYNYAIDNKDNLKTIGRVSILSLIEV